ncbi:MAG: type II toxin-antitoxin system VapB family antitoxin [Pseudomonadales bacterium]
MSTGSVFENNRTQAVRLPADTRFPEGVKRVSVRVVGHDRIISPIEKSWDSFFLTTESVSDDFMAERDQPDLQERESL